MNTCYKIILLMLSLLLITGFEVHEKKSRADFEKLGYIIWEVKTEQKKIALTFDDGPSEKNTKDILELLASYDARATFFVVGQKVKEHPEILKQTYDEGHEIGNHTYKHLIMNKKTSLDTLKQEINETGIEIKRVIGYTPKLFRPPGGVYSERSVQITNDLGYTTILWSWHQDTYDWKHPGVRKIADKVIKNARNGDIVLMHDYNPGTNQTVEALKIILPTLIEKGYEFVTVSELIESSKKSTDQLYPFNQ